MGDTRSGLFAGQQGGSKKTGSADISTAVGVTAAADDLSAARLALAVGAAVLGLVGGNAGADGIGALFGAGHDAPFSIEADSDLGRSPIEFQPELGHFAVDGQRGCCPRAVKLSIARK